MNDISNGNRRLFLHIGLEKTGTSTLQHFLSRNFKALGEYGFVYPRDVDKSYVQRPFHAPIAGVFANQKDFIRHHKMPRLHMVLDELAHDLATDPRDFILSSEHLSSRLTRKEEIERLKETFGDREVRIICYIRRQDDLALSAYSTEVKAGGRRSLNMQAVVPRNPFFDFYRKLDMWASVFGDDRMSVRLYDRSILKGADIRDDFLSLIGIPETDQFIRGSDSNISLDARQLLWLRRLNRFLPQHAECPAMVYHLVNRFRNKVLVSALPKGIPLSALLDTDQRARIMQRFRSGNTRIEQRFLETGALRSWHEQTDTGSDPVENIDIVDDAYRAVLRRPADPSGYSYYTGLARDYVETLLRESAEYQALSTGKAIKCQRGKNPELGWPVSQVMVLRDLKLMFCPIAKVANTSMKNILVEISGRSDLPAGTGDKAHDIHPVLDSTITGLQLGDYSSPEIREILTDPDYFKFALVRDPFDRALSAFWEKFVAGDGGVARQAVPVIAKIQGCIGNEIDEEQGITFRQFVDYVCGSDPLTLDLHWRPQHLYLSGIRYDRIYPLDRLHVLLEDLHVRTGMKPVSRRENVSRSGRGKDVPGAADMFVPELRECGDIERTSFMDEEIMASLKAFYSVDWLLHDMATQLAT